MWLIHIFNTYLSITVFPYYGMDTLAHVCAKESQLCESNCRSWHHPRVSSIKLYRNMCFCCATIVSCCRTFVAPGAEGIRKYNLNTRSDEGDDTVGCNYSGQSSFIPRTVAPWLTVRSEKATGFNEILIQPSVNGNTATVQTNRSLWIILLIISSPQELCAAFYMVHFHEKHLSTGTCLCSFKSKKERLC